MERIGILGGSFDPPHRAHVAMARSALETIPLDRVLVMPAPNPPHKRSNHQTPYALRKEMAALAFAGVDGVEVSGLEEFRDGPSYTVDLLEHFKRGNPDSEAFLIVGADSLADMGQWRDPHRILELATLVVFPRSGYAQVVPVQGDASVVLFESPVIDLSSTELRRAVRAGRARPQDLPEDVYEFVLDNSLYS